MPAAHAKASASNDMCMCTTTHVHACISTRARIHTSVPAFWMRDVSLAFSSSDSFRGGWDCVGGGGGTAWHTMRLPYNSRNWVQVAMELITGQTQEAAKQGKIRVFPP